MDPDEAPGELAKRLAEALTAAGKDQKIVIKELVSLTNLTRQGVTKWFDGGADLKMVNLFQVADYLGVDPRWLATGAGEMKAKKAHGCTHHDIPQRRIDLIRMYSRLGTESRMAARRFIETMSYIEHPRKDEYEKKTSGVSITPSSQKGAEKPPSTTKPRSTKHLTRGHG